MKDKTSIPQAVWDKLKEQKNQLQDRSQVSKALSSSSAMIRIPTQRPIPQLLQKKQRETYQVTKEWTPESAHADQISAQLPSACENTCPMTPRRIQRFSMRKTKAMLKKMQDIQEQPYQKVEKRVSVITEKDPQQKTEREQDELWRDMMKPQEERQFQISRITHFFT